MDEMNDSCDFTIDWIGDSTKNSAQPTDTCSFCSEPLQIRDLPSTLEQLIFDYAKDPRCLNCNKTRFDLLEKNIQEYQMHPDGNGLLHYDWRNFNLLSNIAFVSDDRGSRLKSSSAEACNAVHTLLYSLRTKIPVCIYFVDDIDDEDEDEYCSNPLRHAIPECFRDKEYNEDTIGRIRARYNLIEATWLQTHQRPPHCSSSTVLCLYDKHYTTDHCILTAMQNSRNYKNPHWIMMKEPSPHRMKFCDYVCVLTGNDDSLRIIYKIWKPQWKYTDCARLAKYYLSRNCALFIKRAFGERGEKDRIQFSYIQIRKKHDIPYFNLGEGGMTAFAQAYSRENLVPIF